MQFAGIAWDKQLSISQIQTLRYPIMLSGYFLEYTLHFSTITLSLGGMEHKPKFTSALFVTVDEPGRWRRLHELYEPNH